MLDGISGTMLGVLTALVVSTTLSGLVAESFGRTAGFLSIVVVALLATLLVWFRMPETKPAAKQ